jgi:hypothetical protein
MRIGVVSDTHDHLANVARIVEILNDAGVERVVHTGDITKARTLDVLARLRAPLVGVYGNNDRERESLEAAAARHGFEIVDPPLAGPPSSSTPASARGTCVATTRWAFSTCSGSLRGWSSSEARGRR